MMAVSLNIIFVFLILIYLKRNLFNPLFSKYFWFLAFAKFSFGLAFAIIFKYYYVVDNDTFCYQHDGEMFNFYFWNEPIRFFEIILFDAYECENQKLEFWMHGMDRAMFLDKLVSVIYILFSTNYWVVTIYCSLIAFSTSLYLSQIIVAKYPNMFLATIITFFLYPTLQIWSNGLLKETFALSAFHLIISLGFRNKKWTLISVVVLLSCVFVVFKIKYYYLVIIPFLLFWQMIQIFKMKWLIMGTALVVILACVILKDQLKYSYSVLLFSHDVSYFASYTLGSNNYIGNLTMSIYSAVSHLPSILFKAVFYPLSFYSHSYLQLLNTFFNALLLVFAILSVTYWLGFRYKLKVEFVLLLFFIAISSFLVGVSVPNYGALVRIRIYFEEFVVLLAMYLPSNYFYLLNKNSIT